MADQQLAPQPKTVTSPSPVKRRPKEGGAGSEKKKKKPLAEGRFHLLSPTTKERLNVTPPSRRPGVHNAGPVTWTDDEECMPPGKNPTYGIEPKTEKDGGIYELLAAAREKASPVVNKRTYGENSRGQIFLEMLTCEGENVCDVVHKDTFLFNSLAKEQLGKGIGQMFTGLAFQREHIPGVKTIKKGMWVYWPTTDPEKPTIIDNRRAIIDYFKADTGFRLTVFETPITTQEVDAILTHLTTAQKSLPDSGATPTEKGWRRWRASSLALSSSSGSMLPCCHSM